MAKIGAYSAEIGPQVQNEMKEILESNVEFHHEQERRAKAGEIDAEVGGWVVFSLSFLLLLSRSSSSSFSLEKALPPLSSSFFLVCAHPLPPLSLLIALSSMLYHESSRLNPPTHPPTLSLQ